MLANPPSRDRVLRDEWSIRGHAALVSEQFVVGAMATNKRRPQPRWEAWPQQLSSRLSLLVAHPRLATHSLAIEHLAYLRQQIVGGEWLGQK